MNILFVMDPPQTINPKKDTSYMLMKAYQRLGHQIWYINPLHLEITPSGVQAWGTPLEVFENFEAPFRYGDPALLTLSEMGLIWIRVDPPFDDRYLMCTWILSQLPPHIRVFNHPDGIRSVNEKVWATQFKDLIPPTLITSRLDSAQDFLSRHNKIVAKPTDGFGGSSIFIVSDTDTNASVIFETLSKNGAFVLQKYIPAASQGDKRILLLNGDPIGAVLRVHSDKDHRNNFFAGGHAQNTTITERDLEIIAQLRPHLIKLGLFFVGIDIIGDYLIEVNVTSPTCVQEINALDGVALEDHIAKRSLALV